MSFLLVDMNTQTHTHSLVWKPPNAFKRIQSLGIKICGSSSLHSVFLSPHFFYQFCEATKKPTVSGSQHSIILYKINNWPFPYETSIARSHSVNLNFVSNTKWLEHPPPLISFFSFLYLIINNTWLLDFQRPFLHLLN